MERMIKIAGVCERDLDLLFLEEFVATATFRAWFADRCGVPRPTDGSPFDVQRSVTQSLGESDLEITFNSPKGRIRLLIENKVDAGFQQDQAQRYQDRAATYVVSGQCTEARTVLLAPHGYAPIPGDAKGFDVRVTYEDVRAWFQQVHGHVPRTHYKLALLSAAIEKSRLGYQPEADAPVTQFWMAYWQLAQQLAPELQMQEPLAKPARAGFIYFRPLVLPKGVEICHKLPHGNVDLQFAGWGSRLPELEQRCATALGADMSIEQASKSAVVRLRVPVLDAARSLDEQLQGARAGLRAAAQLLSWYLGNTALLPV